MQSVDTTEEIVGQENLPPVPKSMEGILLCSYKNARAGICSVMLIVDDQILLDVLLRDDIDDTFDKYISTYFTFSDAVHKVCGKLLTLNQRLHDWLLGLSNPKLAKLSLQQKYPQ